MLTRRIIPCLDVKDGRVVKGIKFKGLRDVGDPVERASLYQAQGADEIVFLDVSATPEGRGAHRHTIASVRQRLSIPLTTGGGIKTADDAGRLLDAGADKVSVNTAAVIRPELINELARLFGSQCTVLALDAIRRAGGWDVVIRSGDEQRSIDAVEWAKEAVSRGAGEILLTSVDRDGTRSGYDCELVSAIAGAVSVPVIASGGASDPVHFLEALQAGADAVLAASIFHEGEYSADDLKTYLRQNGIEVRL
ncbi:MAG: imidazole glycerol phosphate synthase subunit HisF [Bdellovibrionota bacterium]